MVPHQVPQIGLDTVLLSPPPPTRWISRRGRRLVLLARGRRWPLILSLGPAAQFHPPPVVGASWQMPEDPGRPLPDTLGSGMCARLLPRSQSTFLVDCPSRTMAGRRCDAGVASGHRAHCARPLAQSRQISWVAASIVLPPTMLPPSAATPRAVSAAEGRAIVPVTAGVVVSPLPLHRRDALAGGTTVEPRLHPGSTELRLHLMRRGRSLRSPLVASVLLRQSVLLLLQPRVDAHMETISPCHLHLHRHGRWGISHAAHIRRFV